METVTKGQPTFDEIFERQGVEEHVRGPEHFFMYEVTSEDSGEHAGEVYAIPRQVVAKDKLYNHLENGTLISPVTEFEESAVIKGRSIIDARRINGGSEIGRECLLGLGVNIYDSLLGDRSVIQESVTICGSILHGSVRVGANSRIELADIAADSRLGHDVRLEPNVSVGKEVCIGNSVSIAYQSVIGEKSTVEVGAKVGAEVTIGSRVLIEEWAKLKDYVRVGDKSRVMPYITLDKGKKIRPNTIVVPDSYKWIKPA